MDQGRGDALWRIAVLIGCAQATLGGKVSSDGGGATWLQHHRSPRRRVSRVVLMRSWQDLREHCVTGAGSRESKCAVGSWSM